MRHPLLPILLACAVLGLAGCQKAVDAATTAAIERASGEKVKIDRDGNRVRISSGEHELAFQGGEGLALPADFPADLFLPDDYGVTSLMDMGHARIVSLTAKGAMSPLFESTRTSMDKHGWKQTLAVQQADSAMLGFAKDEREVAYTFTQDAEDGQVTMALQVLDKRQ